MLLDKPDMCGCASVGHTTTYCAKHDPSPVQLLQAPTINTVVTIRMNRTEQYMLALNILLSLAMLAIMWTQRP